MIEHKVNCPNCKGNGVIVNKNRKTKMLWSLDCPVCRSDGEITKEEHHAYLKAHNRLPSPVAETLAMLDAPDGEKRYIRIEGFDK